LTHEAFTAKLFTAVIKPRCSELVSRPATSTLV